MQRRSLSTPSIRCTRTSVFVLSVRERLHSHTTDPSSRDPTFGIATRTTSGFWAPGRSISGMGLVWARGRGVQGARSCCLGTTHSCRPFLQCACAYVYVCMYMYMYIYIYIYEGIVSELIFQIARPWRLQHGLTIIEAVGLYIYICVYIYMYIHTYVCV